MRAHKTMVEIATILPTDIFCVLVTIVVYTCFIVGDMYVRREMTRRF